MSDPLVCKYWVLRLRHKTTGEEKIEGAGYPTPDAARKALAAWNSAAGAHRAEWVAVDIAPDWQRQVTEGGD